MDNLCLETQRLTIREYTYQDLFNVNKLMSDPVAMRYLDRRHNNIEDTEIYLKNIIEKKSQDPRKIWKMAIDSKDNMNYIGMISLDVETEYLDNGRADLSYYILPEYWRMGFAAEAGREIIRFGFATLNLNKITAGCLKTNTASEKVMISCGMIKEAEFRKWTIHEGAWTNRVEYGILREDINI